MIKKLLLYDGIYYNESPPINLTESIQEKTLSKKYILFDRDFKEISIQDLKQYITIKYSVKSDFKNVNYFYEKIINNQNINLNKDNSLSNISKEISSTKISIDNNENEDYIKFIEEIEKKFSVKLPHTPFYEHFSKYQNVINNIKNKCDIYEEKKNNNFKYDIFDELSFVNNKYLISNKEIYIPECNITHNILIYLITLEKLNFTKDLQIINISNNNLRDTGGAYFLHLINCYSPNILSLNLSGTSLGKFSIEIIKAILGKKNSKLISLDVSDNMLGDSIFNDLCVGISLSRTLKFLYAKKNGLGFMSAKMLENILRYNNVLELLDISDNLYRDESIQPIFNGLKYSNCLKILFCNQLDLTNKVLITINSIMQYNKSLKILSLKHNSFNKRGLCLIENIIHSKNNLEYLNLNCNNFYSKDFEKVEFISYEEFVYNFIYENINELNINFFIDDLYKIIRN